MGRIEIVEKLDTFLNNHAPFTEECHTVYLLVEIRKILDHDKNMKYPLLRFYADWSVHTEKDKITKEMEAIMNDIYQDVAKRITDPYHLERGKVKIVDFVYMEDLQAETEKFLQEYGLPTMLINKANWLEFVKLSVKVLADQPINKPCADIERFSFIPAANDCVGVRIDFSHKVGTYDYYQLRNAY